MEDLYLFLKNNPIPGKQYIRQKAREYAFNYYLRKGVQLDVQKLVMMIEQKLSITVLPESALQNIPNPGPRWSLVDMVFHFYFGSTDKTLTELGHLEEVKQITEEKFYPDFSDEMLEYLIQHKINNQSFSFSYSASVDFRSVEWPHGSSTIHAEFNGETRWINKRRVVSGKMRLSFEDSFTDPADAIETLYGSSNSSEAPEWLKIAANLGGSRYAITDTWNTDYTHTY